jgi:hypothetical protein
MKTTIITLFAILFAFDANLIAQNDTLILFKVLAIPGPKPDEILSRSLEFCAIKCENSTNVIKLKDGNDPVGKIVLKGKEIIGFNPPYKLATILLQYSIIIEPKNGGVYLKAFYVGKGVNENAHKEFLDGKIQESFSSIAQELVKFIKSN